MNASWPLPDTPHIPGRTRRPVTSPAFDAAAAAPLETIDQMWRENTTYLYGLDLYAAGFFWEAHEVWEPVWIRSTGNSRERLLVQGLIQLSNACLKIAMNRPAAARRLLQISQGKLREAAIGGPILMGVELHSLADAVRDYDAQLDADQTEDTAILLRHRPELITTERTITPSDIA